MCYSKLTCENIVSYNCFMVLTNYVSYVVHTHPGYSISKEHAASSGTYKISKPLMCKLLNKLSDATK